MTNGEYQQLVEFLGRQFTVIDQRFTAIDRRFDVIDRRLDEHDERFREILGHFDAIYLRFERLEQEYLAIVEALRRIEAALVDEGRRRAVLERGLAELKERVALLQARIEDIERRLRT